MFSGGVLFLSVRVFKCGENTHLLLIHNFILLTHGAHCSEIKFMPISLIKVIEKNMILHLFKSNNMGKQLFAQVLTINA